MAFLLNKKAGKRKVKGKKSGKKSVKTDPEVLELVEELNQKWVEQTNTLNDFDEIIRIADQIIEKDDKVLVAYEKLGYVHERLGNHKKLFVTMKLAADIKQTDTDSWLDCARKAATPEVALWNESIYCYNRAINQLRQ